MQRDRENEKLIKSANNPASILEQGGFIYTTCDKYFIHAEAHRKVSQNSFMIVFMIYDSDRPLCGATSNRILTIRSDYRKLS